MPASKVLALSHDRGLGPDVPKGILCGEVLGGTSGKRQMKRRQGRGGQLQTRCHGSFVMIALTQVHTYTIC